MQTPAVLSLLGEIGVGFEARTLAFTDLARAEEAHIHHTRVPIAACCYALLSPAFAKGRFPAASLRTVVSARPTMDDLEVSAFAQVFGQNLKPPFSGNSEPFAQTLRRVIEQYGGRALFLTEPAALGSHFGIKPAAPDKAWKGTYRALAPAQQMMAASILWLYNPLSAPDWLGRAPHAWHVAEALPILRDAGVLSDWAELVARYPGW